MADGGVVVVQIPDRTGDFRTPKYSVKAAARGVTLVRQSKVEEQEEGGEFDRNIDPSRVIEFINGS